MVCRNIEPRLYTYHILQFYDFRPVMNMWQKLSEKLLCMELEMACIDAWITSKPFGISHFFVNDKLYVIILIVQ